MKKITEVPSDITTLIGSGKVFMFSKSTCPYCMRAKNKLEKLKIPFEYIEVNQANFSPEQIQKLHEISNHRTYPNIFVGKKPTGGCDDLMKLIADKELRKLLDQEHIQYDNEALTEAEAEKPQTGLCNLI